MCGEVVDGGGEVVRDFIARPAAERRRATSYCTVSISGYSIVTDVPSGAAAGTWFGGLGEARTLSISLSCCIRSAGVNVFLLDFLTPDVCVPPTSSAIVAL